ncbi:MAG: 4Fe-4S binding protein, partial [Pirellulaceae bacterium]|nr:4Fe-4S binding protein [Pirellulaceae bacterium]
VLAIPFWLGDQPLKVGDPENPTEISLFFCSLCPAGALEGAVPNVVNSAAMGAEEIPWPSTIKMVILGLFVVAMFFVRRPWCTIFCPLGAIYGLFNRVSFFLVRFHDKKCIDCAKCRSICQYGGRADLRIDSVSCNRCLVGEDCRAITLGTALDRVDDGGAGGEGRGTRDEGRGIEKVGL